MINFWSKSRPTFGRTHVWDNERSGEYAGGDKLVARFDVLSYIAAFGLNLNPSILEIAVAGADSY